MLRVAAFISGVVAGVVLFFFVVLGVGHADGRSVDTSARAVATSGSGQGDVLARPTDSHSPFIVDGDDDPEDGAQLDLQGDEVTPAVARYRFDAQGNIYETHAPHTEVPKLGSPQS